MILQKSAPWVISCDGIGCMAELRIEFQSRAHAERWQSVALHCQGWVLLPAGTHDWPEATVYCRACQAAGRVPAAERVLIAE